MSDVIIDVTTLSALNSALKRILVEFDEDGSTTGELQDAIDRPADRSGLRDRTRDFESGWDDRRSALVEKLTAIQASVESTCTGWLDFDSELANNLTLDASGAAAPVSDV
ncbi:hypothetical protein OVN20_04405 [Microcella daejeonensis]|uniref:hypothetical protein n=1 Tax=Microcella daejeonensis TaxID=2994971 RepID=UPI00227138BC|nr:hypothetical protein [Microcella daejeonensis]WAB84814.1 hypothetical protein OVN20_04405 [Microcella daejeonensis]